MKAHALIRNGSISLGLLLALSPVARALPRDVMDMRFYMAALYPGFDTSKPYMTTRADGQKLIEKFANTMSFDFETDFEKREALLAKTAPVYPSSTAYLSRRVPVVERPEFLGKETLAAYAMNASFRPTMDEQYESYVRYLESLTPTAASKGEVRKVLSEFLTVSKYQFEAGSMQLEVFTGRFFKLFETPALKAAPNFDSAFDSGMKLVARHYPSEVFARVAGSRALRKDPRAAQWLDVALNNLVQDTTGMTTSPFTVLNAMSAFPNDSRFQGWIEKFNATFGGEAEALLQKRRKNESIGALQRRLRCLASF